MEEVEKKKKKKNQYIIGIVYIIKQNNFTIICIVFSNHICIISQGGWENDETVQDAAIREAVEEAGVRGELVV